MEQFKHTPENKFEFEPTADPDEAQEIIDLLLEQGFKPTVTVPKDYTESLKEGLRAHTTWIPNFNVIAGTLGRDAYQATERVVVEINTINRKAIHPRFTGPEKTFQGVVIIDGPISPDQITIH